MAEHAVSYFVPDNPNAVKTAAGRIWEHVTTLERAISDGLAVDYADYRHRCGVVRGFRQAMAFIEGAHEEIERK